MLSDRCWSFPVSLPVPVLLVFSLVFPWVRRVTLESCFLLHCGFCTLTITHHDGEFCTRIITHHAGEFGTRVTTLLLSAILGLECFFLIKRAFTCIRVYFTWQNDLTKHYGCSKFRFADEVRQPQCFSHGSAAGEYHRHWARGASARDAGVRAHPTVPRPEKSHCATHNASSPHFTGATPTRSWELCWWAHILQSLSH